MSEANVLRRQGVALSGPRAGFPKELHCVQDFYKSKFLKNLHLNFALLTLNF